MFHSVHGESVTLDTDRVQADRTGRGPPSVVFSCETVRTGEVFTIQVKETSTAVSSTNINVVNSTCFNDVSSTYIKNAYL